MSKREESGHSEKKKLKSKQESFLPTCTYSSNNINKLKIYVTCM